MVLEIVEVREGEQRVCGALYRVVLVDHFERSVLRRNKTTVRAIQKTEVG